MLASLALLVLDVLEVRFGEFLEGGSVVGVSDALWEAVPYLGISIR